MNQHEQDWKILFLHSPWVKEKNKLSHPFTYIRKFSHTLCQKAQLTWPGQQFQTGSISWEHLCFTVEWGWTFSSTWGSWNVSIRNPCWFTQLVRDGIWSIQQLLLQHSPVLDCASEATCQTSDLLQPHLLGEKQVTPVSETRCSPGAISDLNPFFHPHLSKKIYFLPWTITSAIFFFNVRCEALSDKFSLAIFSEQVSI